MPTQSGGGHGRNTWTIDIALHPRGNSNDQRLCQAHAWLSLAIGAINIWNRVQVGFRVPHPTALPHAA